MVTDVLPSRGGGGAPARVIVVTGTGTGVGKTVVTAALAALSLDAGARVAVLKPAQTGVAPGEPGDAAEVARLAGPVTPRELTRYAEPLAPATAARRAGVPGLSVAAAAEAVGELCADHDVVLVEGAGGLLVRFNEAGETIADLAAKVGAPALVVARAGLGTLNATALTTEALRARGLRCLGVVVGSWPAEPDLAARCNREELPDVAGAPLLGALPAGAGRLARPEFRDAAHRWLALGMGERPAPGPSGP